MIILISSILSADLQAARANSSLFIQSGPGPFSNYQHHLDSFSPTVNLLEFSCHQLLLLYEKWMISHVCHPASLSLPAGEQAQNGMYFSGFPGCWLSCRVRIAPKAIRQAVEADRCAGLHRAAQGDLLPASETEIDFLLRGSTRSTILRPRVSPEPGTFIAKMEKVAYPASVKPGHKGSVRAFTNS